MSDSAPDNAERWAGLWAREAPPPEGEHIGEISPDPWTSVDVSYHWWPGEAPGTGKIDLMVFGEGEGGDSDDEMLYEKETIRLSAADARHFAQLLLDAASRIEGVPGGEGAWRHFQPSGEAASLN